MFEAVERTIDIRPCIRHHINPSDLETRALRIDLLRVFPAQVITDNRCGQPFESDETVHDGVAEVEEHGGTRG